MAEETETELMQKSKTLKTYGWKRTTISELQKAI